MMCRYNLRVAAPHPTPDKGKTERGSSLPLSGEGAATGRL